LTIKYRNILFYSFIYLTFCFSVSSFIGVNIFQTTFNHYGTFDDFENMLKVPSLYEFRPEYLGITPFTVVLYRQLNRFDLYFNLPLFLTLNVSILIYLLCRLNTSLRKLSYFFLISWPLIFLISRANNDLIILNILIATLFVPKKVDFLRPILIGLAISIDITFIFAFFLMGQEKIIKKTMIMFTTFISLNFIYPFYLGLLSGSFFAQYVNQIWIYRQKMVTQKNGSLFSNSVDFGIDSIYNYFSIENSPSNLILFLQITIGLMFVTGLILYYSVANDINVNLFGFSIVFYLLIFSPSPDYKLVFLVVPLIIYLLKMDATSIYKTEFYLTFLIWLPKHFIYFGSSDTFAGYSLSSFFNSTLLIILFIVYFKRILLNYQSTLKTKNLKSLSSK
jgi:hypothetical protein